MDRLPDSGLKSYLASFNTTLAGIQIGKGKDVEVRREKGRLQVRADERETLFPLLRELDLAEKGNVLPHKMGTVQIKYPLRLIEWFGEESEELAQRMLENGFNGVIVQEGGELFRQEGLKVLPKLWVQWEEQRSEEQTSLDGMLAFLDSIEEQEVIVEAAAETAEGRVELAAHFEELQDGCRKGISLSFAADDGHDLLHPIWEALHRSPDVSGTPLLPIWNGGLLDLGEGLWPCLPLDFLERGLLQCRRQRFVGGIVRLRRLPQRGTLHDGILYSLGHTLWRGGSMQEAWEEWNRAEGGFSEAEQALMRGCDGLARRLRRFQRASKPVQQAEMINRRSEGEALLAQLNLLALASDERMPTFRFFLRDAKKILFHALQEHNLTLPNVLTGDDMQPSFWASMAAGAGRGMATGGKVTLLDEPDLEGSDELSEMYGKLVVGKAVQEIGSPVA